MRRSLANSVTTLAGSITRYLPAGAEGARGYDIDLAVASRGSSLPSPRPISQCTRIAHFTPCSPILFHGICGSILDYIKSYFRGLGEIKRGPRFRTCAGCAEDPSIFNKMSVDEREDMLFAMVRSPHCGGGAVSWTETSDFRLSD